jgi:hypothetical protein
MVGGVPNCFFPISRTQQKNTCVDFKTGMLESFGMMGYYGDGLHIKSMSYRHRNEFHNPTQTCYSVNYISFLF